MRSTLNGISCEPLRNLSLTLLALTIALLISLAHVQNGRAQDARSNAPDNAVEIDSRITTVTVFREQANVIREIKLSAAADRQTIRVTGLPRTLRNQSIRWESEADISVRSLRVSQRKISLSKDDQQRRQEAVASLVESIQDSAHDVAVIEQDLETIEDLVSFSSDQTNDDLIRSKLDVSSVTEIADFVMQRRRSLAKELHVARRQLQEKEDELEQTRRRFASEDQPTSSSSYDAVLSVEAPAGGLLRLSYWVDDVSWEPQYTIHAISKPDAIDQFTVQLDGNVTQNSGEDWRDVQVVFCTGVPDLQANGPLLAPLRVAANQADGASNESMALFDTAPANQVPPSWEDPASWQRNVSLNIQAAGRQVYEINRRQSVQREVANDANNNLADETYKVAGKIDIDHQTNSQAITIFRSDVSSPIYRVVTPLLSSFAYREAALENKTGQSLVGGNATVFLDGRFVGRTTLPPTAAGAEFAVGLGADRQVRTRRELLSREESIKGGNRLSTLKYRLVISNYHPTEIDIRLFDRLPITNDSGSVNVVADTDSFGTLSADAKYLRMQRPTGILRWDLVIPAKRFGSDAYDHHYEYTVEMDRTHSIVSNDVEQQMRRDLRFNQSGGGGMGGGMGGFGGFGSGGGGGGGSF